MGNVFSYSIDAEKVLASIGMFQPFKRPGMDGNGMPVFLRMDIVVMEHCGNVQKASIAYG